MSGVTRTLADDFTFMCLDMSWARLLLFVSACYVAVSCVFAASFWALMVRASTLLWPPGQHCSAGSLQLACGAAV